MGNAENSVQVSQYSIMIIQRMWKPKTVGGGGDEGEQACVGNLDEIIDRSFYFPRIDPLPLNSLLPSEVEEFCSLLVFLKEEENKPLSASRLLTPGETCCQEVGGPEERSRAWTAPEVWMSFSIWHSEQEFATHIWNKKTLLQLSI